MTHEHGSVNRATRTNEETENNESEATEGKPIETNRRRFLKQALGGSGAALIGFGGVASASNPGAGKRSSCTTMPPMSQGKQEIGDIQLTEVTEKAAFLSH